MDSTLSTAERQKSSDSSTKQFSNHETVGDWQRLVPGNLRGRFLAVLFGVLLPSLTIFGILHHGAVKESLLDEVDQTLFNLSRELKQLIISSDIDSPEEFDQFQMASSALMLSSAPEVYIEIMDGSGKTLWASRNLEGKSIPVLLENAEGQNSIESIDQPDGLKLRRLVTPLSLRDGTKVFIVLAESLNHLEIALRGSIGRTVLFGLIVLVLTEMAANLAFRGLFYPLRQLVDTAEAIVSTDDVSRRVPVYLGADKEIKRTAVAFNQLMERVEVLLEMARRLLADTSHELRNPLTVIMTDLDLLREDLTAEQREEVVDEAQKTVRRLTRLVSDLLLLSRTEAHSETVHYEEIDLIPFTQKLVVRMNKTLSEEEKIDVLRSPGECLAVLNPEKTEQILTNLLENALRYSDGQNVRIYVSEEGEEILLSVKDSGCGIAEEEQKKIFQRFYRVDLSRNRHSGGTGLGLSVAKALTELQGGTISVSSKLGEGAEFQVRFPKAGSHGCQSVASV